MALNLNPYTGQFEDSEAPVPAVEKMALVAPDGKEQIVDPASAAGLLKAGYRPETEKDKEDRSIRDEESFNTGKAFTEGMGRGVTFGLSDVVLNKLIRTPEEVRHAEIRKEEQPIAGFGGEATGIAATIAGTALLKTAGAVGQFAARALPLNIAERLGAGAAEKVVASRVAQKFLTNEALKTAAKIGTESAIETGLYSAGERLGEESFSEDHDLTSAETAEAVLASGLVGGLFGGVMGSTFSLGKGAIGNIFKKTDKVILNETEKVAQKEIEIKIADGSMSEEHALQNLSSQFGDNKAAQILADSNLESPMAKDFRLKLKSNAPQIKDAFSSLREQYPEAGIGEPDMSMLSADQRARDFGGVLQQVSEQYRSTQVNPIKEAVSKDVASRAASDVEASASARVGEEILNKKAAEFAATKEGFSEVYDKIRAAQQGQFIGEEQEFLKTTAKGLLESKYVTSGSDAGKYLKDAAERISNAPTLEALDQIERDLGGQARSLARSGREDIAGVLQDLRGELETGRLDIVKQQIKDPELLNQFSNVRQQYAKYKQAMGTFGRETGLGKISQPDQILDKIHGTEFKQGMGYEKWSDNLIRRFESNEQFRKVLKAEHPDIYIKSLELAKANVREATYFDGKYELKKFLRHVDGWTPEAQNEILGSGAADTIKNVKIISQAIPEIFNPSKSGIVKHIVNLATGRGIGDAVGAAAMYSMIAVQKARNVLGNEVDNVMGRYFKTLVTEGSKKSAFYEAVSIGEKKLEGMIGLAKKSFPEQIEAVNRASENLEHTQSVAQSRLHGLSVADPDLGQLLTMGTVRAVQYLKENIPKAELGGPLDKDPKHQISSKEQFLWKKKFETVVNPYSVLEDMIKGKLVPEKVSALKTVYPEIYNRMVKSAFDVLSNKKAKLSYPQKMQIAILTGSAVTRGLKPSYLLQMQQSWASIDQSKPGEKPLAGSRKPDMSESVNSINPASSTIRKRSVN